MSILAKLSAATCAAFEAQGFPCDLVLFANQIVRILRRFNVMGLWRRRVSHRRHRP